MFKNKKIIINIQKYILQTIIFTIAVMMLVSCSNNSKKNLSTADFLSAFKSANLSVMDEVTFTSDSDPNKKLGRPNEYIAKSNFKYSSSDSSANLTIEIFNNSNDAKNRSDYINKAIASVKNINLKQYIYLDDKYLLRLPYSLTPDEAQKYKDVFTKLISGR